MNTMKIGFPSGYLDLTQAYNVMMQGRLQTTDSEQSKALFIVSKISYYCCYFYVQIDDLWRVPLLLGSSEQHGRWKRVHQHPLYVSRGWSDVLLWVGKDETRKLFDWTQQSQCGYGFSSRIGTPTTQEYCHQTPCFILARFVFDSFPRSVWGNFSNDNMPISNNVERFCSSLAATKETEI